MNAAPRTPVIGVVGRDVPIELIEAYGATVRRLELHSEIPPSHYEPGGSPNSKPPTTGANAGGKDHTEEREAVQL